MVSYSIHNCILFAVLWTSLWHCSQAYIGPDGVCQIDVFAPFTRRNGDRAIGLQVRTDMSRGFSDMAAAAMAADHFNSRNASLVPELAHIKNCSVHLEIGKVFDTSYDSHGVAPLFLQRLLQLGNESSSICALAGPSHDTPAGDLDALAYAARIPMVSTMNSLVVRNKDGLTRTSVFPDLLEKAIFVVSYLFYHERFNYIALIYPLSDKGLQMHSSLGFILDQNNIRWMAAEYLESVSVSVTQSGATDEPVTRSIRDAVRRVKESGYRTIILAMDDPLTSLVPLADAFEEFDMNKGGYFTLAVDPVDLNGQDLFTENIARLATGSCALLPTSRDMFSIDVETPEPLWTNWKQLDQTFMDRLKKLNPIQDITSAAYVNATLDLFRNDYLPEYGAGFIYDAVMSIGFGACQATPEPDGSVDGLRHHEAIRNARFFGATGDVKFGEALQRDGTRPGSSLSWLVQNWYREADGHLSSQYPHYLDPRLDPGTGAGNNLRPLRLASGGIFEYEWKSLSDLFLQFDIPIDLPYIYAGNTTIRPSLLRDVGEPNYLSTSARIAGLTSMAVAMFVALCLGVWVFICRKHRVLAASQPPFLYVICFGVIVQSATVFCRSFDEGAGWSQASLTANCNAMPWMFCLGHMVVTCTLFTKLWRVHATLQFSRRRLKLIHFLWPMVLLMVSAVLILALWTGLDPLVWDRSYLNEETGETLGRCRSNGQVARYLVPLAFVLIVAGGLMAYMAWKTRDVDERYSESKQIFLLIFVQLEVLLVSLPILLRVDKQDIDSSYLVFFVVVLTFPWTTMGFVFGHKVRAYVREKRGVDETKRKRGEIRGQPQVTGLEYPDSQVAPVPNTSPPTQEYTSSPVELEDNSCLDSENTPSIDLENVSSADLEENPEGNSCTDLEKTPSIDDLEKAPSIDDWEKTPSIDLENVSSTDPEKNPEANPCTYLEKTSSTDDFEQSPSIDKDL